MFGLLRQAQHERKVLNSFKLSSVVLRFSKNERWFISSLEYRDIRGAGIAGLEATAGL